VGGPGWVAAPDGWPRRLVLILNLIWARCRGVRRFARAEAQATVGGCGATNGGHAVESLILSRLLVGGPGWVAAPDGWPRRLVLILNLIWARCRGVRRFARAEAEATVGRLWGHPMEMLAVPVWR
jgi:hypothetical protein